MDTTIIQPYFDIYFNGRVLTPFQTDTPARMRIYDALSLRRTPAEALTIMPSAFCIWLICYNRRNNAARFVCAGSAAKPVTLYPGRYDCCYAVIFDDDTLYFNQSPYSSASPAALRGEILEYEPAAGSREYHLIEELRRSHCPEPVLNADLLSERFRLFEDFLNTSKSRYIIPEEILHIHHLIKKACGNMDLRTLSEKTGYSIRHINRMFTAQFGYGPKDYSRYVRFQKALKEIFNNPYRQNSAFIENIGYSDQAHFQREFRFFMQETPKQFIKRLCAPSEN